MREATKLDVLSQGTAPLGSADLETLEILCSCSRRLQIGGAEPQEPDEPQDTAADLKAVSG